MATEIGQTYDQPTLAPTIKIQAAGIAGSITTLIIFTASQFHIELTGEVAAAIVTLIMLGAAYFKRERIM